MAEKVVRFTTSSRGIKARLLTVPWLEISKPRRKLLMNVGFFGFLIVLNETRGLLLVAEFLKAWSQS